MASKYNSDILAKIQLKTFDEHSYYKFAQRDLRCSNERYRALKRRRNCRVERGSGPSTYHPAARVGTERGTERFTTNTHIRIGSPGVNANGNLLRHVRACSGFARTALPSCSRRQSQFVAQFESLLSRTYAGTWTNCTWK